MVLHLEGTDAPLTIVSASAVADGPGWRLVFREVPDRTAAEALRGSYLEATLDPQEALGRGEYFWHEVVGCRVVDVDGADLGTVHDLYRVAGTEVMVVRGGPHGEFDVPIVRSLVRIFAPRRGEIVVDGSVLDLGAPVSPRDDDGPAAERPKAPRRRTRKPRTAAATAHPGDVASDGVAGESSPPTVVTVEPPGT